MNPTIRTTIAALSFVNDAITFENASENKSQKRIELLQRAATFLRAAKNERS